VITTSIGPPASRSERGCGIQNPFGLGEKANETSASSSACRKSPKR
jgi:hypothetical protein